MVVCWPAQYWRVGRQGGVRGQALSSWANDNAYIIADTRLAKHHTHINIQTHTVQTNIERETYTPPPHARHNLILAVATQRNTPQKQEGFSKSTSRVIGILGGQHWWHMLWEDGQTGDGSSVISAVCVSESRVVMIAYPPATAHMFGMRNSWTWPRAKLGQSDTDGAKLPVGHYQQNTKNNSLWILTEMICSPTKYYSLYKKNIQNETSTWNPN